MTWQGSPQSRPSLPWRRPWWLAVLLAMLAFGLVQEQAKIKVNHYLQVADDEQLWDEDAETRQAWWEKKAPVDRHNFYVSRDTWPMFHGFARAQLVRFKWALSAVILLAFLGLDVLLLRATGVAERMPWLFLIYASAGFPMLGLAFSTPGEGWYAFARTMLGFLQSPLPSVMVVLVPWFLERMAPHANKEG